MPHRFDTSNIKWSPAIPAAVLLYGIVFLFAAAYYANIQWQRPYTIALYVGVLFWGEVPIFLRLQQGGLRFNLVDFLFGIFSVCLLISIGIKWWDDTAHKLVMMPFFFFLPYVLGRAIRIEDCHVLRGSLLLMGTALLLLILPEYLRVLKYGLPYTNSPAPVLFGLGHGVMLSGLLLSVALLGAVSLLLSPEGYGGFHYLKSGRWRYLGYALIFLIIVTIGWISSRGPAVSAIVGIGVLYSMTRQASWRRRIELAFVIILSIGAAVAHSLERKENAGFYADLVQVPVAIGENVERIPADNAPRTHSILGDEACNRIIDSVSDRWVHYEQAVAVFLAHPWFGAGANHYGFFACTGPGSFPHNTILQVFSELGGIVALIYCALLAATIWILFRRWRMDDPRCAPLWSWLVAFTIMQMLIAQINGDYFISAALYFVVGVAASVENGANRSIEGL